MGHASSDIPRRIGYSVVWSVQLKVIVEDEVSHDHLHLQRGEKSARATGRRSDHQHG